MRQRRMLVVAGVALIVLILLVVVLVRSCAPRKAETSDQGQDQVTEVVEPGGNAVTSATPDSPASPATAASPSTASSPSTPSTPSTPLTSATDGVEDPWIPGGIFTTGNAELDQKVKEYCDEFSVSETSAEDNAYNTYLHITWTEYVEKDNDQDPEGPDWSIKYALQILNEGDGNCYEFVALTQWCLRYFGYEDALAQPCIVKKSSGNWGDHGLLFVTNKDGERCVCDDALSSKGWMLPIDALTYEIKDIGQGNLTTEYKPS